MPDIFISYSRKDSAQAEQLAELLGSAGLSCWIDKAGIDLATSWSKEIVQAIDQCSAFVVLLSAASNKSTNVHKEVSLASEKKKKILPLDLEPIQISEDLQYHLAGIQRASMTNIDAIIRALANLGLEVTGAPQPPKIVKEMDGRKSLMILPFEDLSPTGDNQWFADGIVSEMISSLSNVKALRVMDAATTKEYKGYKGHLTTYAREMSIRFFVQGDVRKFGDNIKITSRLLDIETGDHLWQDSMKGTMNDIFDIQEKVAEKVVEGLKVHLASDEKKKLAERGTENVEAYELNLKAHEYFDRHTRDGYQLAVQLSSEAIELDSRYASAYSGKANALANLYRGYQRDSAILEEGLHLVREAIRLKPDLWMAYLPLSVILMFQGKLEDAERTAKEYIQHAPEDSKSHFALGYFYAETGQLAKAIAPFEEAVKLKPEDLPALFNLMVCCDATGDSEKLIHWANAATPIYVRHLKLFPQDENRLVQQAVVLRFAGRIEEARDAARRLEYLKDGMALYNIACLQCELEDYEASLNTFRSALQAGYRHSRLLNELLNHPGFATLQGTLEFESVREMVEKINADTAAAREAQML
ncbi:MAG: TIR domain-containing protein [Candidatus Kapaibacterium sp.]